MLSQCHLLNEPATRPRFAEVCRVLVEVTGARMGLAPVRSLMHAAAARKSGEPRGSQHLT